MVTAFYPGSFDPPTLGHINITQRAATIFTKLIVGVYNDTSQKQPTFSADERLSLFNKAIDEIQEQSCGLQKTNITVTLYSGITVHTAREMGANVLVRGLRIGGDFEYERELALINRVLDSKIDTVCLLSSLQYQYISSSRIKEMARLGGDISTLVPKCVVKPVLDKLQNIT